ncbi:hypothetical protein BASA81_013126 [Batrachochytrium salamandrivorans]|nr:hypothetical protein BASA81_013126 [Batrachochytrium salamandrivorans]
MACHTQEGVPNSTPFCSCSVEGYVVKYSLQQQFPRAWLCASHRLHRQERWRPSQPRRQARHCPHQCHVGLKLVCKVLQMRIERFVETNNLLSYEQAGCRKREECVGQVVLTCRHHSAQTECWAKHPCLFIDIRKAFDTSQLVHCYGSCKTWDFPRRTLAFLKAL